MPVCSLTDIHSYSEVMEKIYSICFMSDFIEIDGSFGEGGGQILRTSLSLSCITGRPLRIYNIRKGRRRPGLMPQHLTVVRALSLISGGEAIGDEKGSLELRFIPGQVRAGHYRFDIGTAGSTTLVLQALIPPLILQQGVSRITLTGGTHVPHSPCFHYIKEVFLSFLGMLGIHVEAGIEMFGFYPKGGGRIWAEVRPAKEIRGIFVRERGKLLSIKGCSGVSNLPLSIAERQRQSALEILRPCSPEIDIDTVPSVGKGTFIFLKLITENTVAGFSSLGERGKRAEDVGREVADAALSHIHSRAALDPYIADQLVLYLALSKKESSFSTSRITKHLITNLHVIKAFTGLSYRIEGASGEHGIVDMWPAESSPLISV